MEPRARRAWRSATSRLEDQRLHLLRLTLEHIGYLPVPHVGDVRQDEGSTLRKVAKIGEQVAQLGAPLDLLGEAAVEMWSTSSTGRSRRARMMLMQGLRAILYSQGWRRISSCVRPSARDAEGVLKGILGVLLRSEHVAVELSSGRW